MLFAIIAVFFKFIDIFAFDWIFIGLTIDFSFIGVHIIIGLDKRKTGSSHPVLQIFWLLKILVDIVLKKFIHYKQIHLIIICLDGFCISYIRIISLFISYIYYLFILYRDNYSILSQQIIISQSDQHFQIVKSRNKKLEIHLRKRLIIIK